MKWLAIFYWNILNKLICLYWLHNFWFWWIVCESVENQLQILVIWFASLTSTRSMWFSPNISITKTNNHYNNCIENYNRSILHQIDTVYWKQCWTRGSQKPAIAHLVSNLTSKVPFSSNLDDKRNFYKQ